MLVSSCEAEAGVPVDFRAIVAVCLYMVVRGWMGFRGRGVIPK